MERINAFLLVLVNIFNPFFLSWAIGLPWNLVGSAAGPSSTAFLSQSGTTKHALTTALSMTPQIIITLISESVRATNAVSDLRFL